MHGDSCHFCIKLFGKQTLWLINCLLFLQLGTQRALKTWTWTLCVFVFSVSWSGMMAEKTAWTQCCPTPSMTRVRHCRTLTTESWPHLPATYQLLLQLFKHVFPDCDMLVHLLFYLPNRGDDYIAAQDQPFEPVQRSLHRQDRDLHAVWQGAER